MLDAFLDISVWELHPMLVHFPITFVIVGGLLDVAALQKPELDRAAMLVAIAGATTGLAAALTGIVAMQTVPTHEEAGHEAMVVHGILQGAGVVAWVARAAWGWLARHRGTPLGARVLGWLAAGTLVLGSAIGGHLVFHLGVGVTPNAVTASPRGTEHGAHMHGH